MIKKFLLPLIIILFTACTAQNSVLVSPVVVITGDVVQTVELKSYENLQQYEISVDEKQVKAVKISDALSKAQTVGQDIEVLIESYDGVSALVSLEELENTYLYIDTDSHWCVSSQDLPVQSGIKYIEKIVVAANTLEHRQNCFRIINGSQDYAFGYGKMYMEDCILSTVFEGQPSLNGKELGVYKKRNLIPLSNYYQSADSAIGYFADGSQQEIDPKGYILWRGNSADYVSTDKKTTVNNIIGVWFDPYEKCIDYVGQYALENKDENIMIIELDGYGYTAHQQHMPQYLSGLNAEPIRTVMPSVSNVALATLVTGKTPDQTGVKITGDRELLIDDIFSQTENSVIIEGNTSLISMSIDQILSIDTNNNGTNDDEVYDNAIKVLKDNPQLIYVHFHGFDDIAHTYGPYSQQAKEKIDQLDKYVEGLVKEFDGTVLITADHGQHEREYEDKIGNHGEFVYEDMTVPLFIVGEEDEQ